jgi:2-polyprenyl-3-methyl-5-hydroxy-6-metoxy-1,4-benzoquinol methylase
MAEEETIEFHRPSNQNDIQLVQDLVYPIFSKKTKKNKHYLNEIRSLFLTAMKNAHLSFFIRHIFWLYVNRTITSGLKKGLPLIEVEQTLRKFIRKRVDPEKDRKALALERSKRSFELVKDYIVGDSILDLGAGEGLLGLEIKNNSTKKSNWLTL